MVFNEIEISPNGWVSLRNEPNDAILIKLEKVSWIGKHLSLLTFSLNDGQLIEYQGGSATAVYNDLQLIIWNLNLDVKEKGDQ